MRSIKVLVFCVGVSLLCGSLLGQSEFKRMFKTSYLGFDPATGQNTMQQGIIFQFPDPVRFGLGPYPLAIWTGGSLSSYQGSLSTTMVAQMANRGFVSASVEYANTNGPETCTDYTQRALGIFDASRLSSAITVLCTVKGVACNGAIVTSGISQGAALAILAKNYAPTVAAVYAISISDFNQSGGISLASCLDDQVTAISSDKLTVVNGESDTVFGGQTPLMNLTGLECPTGTLHCWSPALTGAGWYIVQDSQVQDHVADHCYPLFGGCTDPVGFDMNWYLHDYNWSLKSNLDWLATFGTKRISEQ